MHRSCPFMRYPDVSSSWNNKALFYIELFHFAHDHEESYSAFIHPFPVAARCCTGRNRAVSILCCHFPYLQRYFTDR